MRRDDDDLLGQGPCHFTLQRFPDSVDGASPGRGNMGGSQCFSGRPNGSAGGLQHQASRCAAMRPPLMATKELGKMTMMPLKATKIMEGSRRLLIGECEDNARRQRSRREFSNRAKASAKQPVGCSSPTASTGPVYWAGPRWASLMPPLAAWAGPSWSQRLLLEQLGRRKESPTSMRPKKLRTSCHSGAPTPTRPRQFNPTLPALVTNFIDSIISSPVPSVLGRLPTLVPFAKAPRKIIPQDFTPHCSARINNQGTGACKHVVSKAQQVMMKKLGVDAGEDNTDTEAAACYASLFC
uniref:Uncharacterized protein n=1 Tax=Oryza brachyantha TaxID=4533 RepID=J3L1P4_ORYBR